jgi:hypothetical protein
MAEFSSSSQEQSSLFDTRHQEHNGAQMPPPEQFRTQKLLLDILIAVFAVLFFYLLYKNFFVKEETPLATVPTPRVEIVKPKITLSNTTQIDVLNGSGASGIGMKVTQHLRSLGIDVIDVGNISHTDESFIIDRIGNRTEAQQLARTVGFDTTRITVQIAREYMVKYSLVLGKDFGQYFPDIPSKNK